jgi:hypothetical protein
MSYDMHIIRSKHWLDAASTPITKNEVDQLVADDPELAWSTTDYVNMKDKTGVVTRNYMITWRGQSCFWWNRDQIQCSGPDDAQQRKLIQIAGAMKAFAVGDDDERYELKKDTRGVEEIVVIEDDA